MITSTGSSVFVPSSVVDFNSRAAVLGDVLSNLRLVEDQAPTRGGRNPAPLMQTTEITRAMSTFRAQARLGGTLPINAAQLADLASASHTACHELGVALRRELTRPDSSLRYTAPALADDARRTAPTRVSPVNVAANALVNLQPPNRHVSEWIAPAQRSVLRTTLENTPPTGRTPFPVWLALLGRDWTANAADPALTAQPIRATTVDGTP